MAQPICQYHEFSHDSFLDSTFIRANKVIHPHYDDLLLTLFGNEKQSFLWHIEDIYQCPSIIAMIDKILNGPFGTESDNLDFQWQTNPDYQFLGFEI